MIQILRMTLVVAAALVTATVAPASARGQLANPRPAPDLSALPALDVVSVKVNRCSWSGADTPRLADADVLWLKARLLKRWEAERRVRRPIELMEPFEIAASVAAAMLLLSWSVPSAFDWLPRLTYRSG